MITKTNTYGIKKWFNLFGILFSLTFFGALVFFLPNPVLKNISPKTLTNSTSCEKTNAKAFLNFENRPINYLDWTQIKQTCSLQNTCSLPNSSILAAQKYALK